MIANRYICKLGWNVGLGLLLLASAQFAVSGQSNEESKRQASLPPTMDLRRGDVIRFDKQGPAAVSSKIKCGPGGDIYAVYSSTSSQEMWGNPIRRISVSSHSVTEYPVPSISGYQRIARVSFDVSADGTLYSLLQAYPQLGSDKSERVYLVAKYKNDGQVDSSFTIGDIPGKHIRPIVLSMFGADDSLVSGTTTPKDSGTPLGVFSAIFDRGGRFRAPISIMKFDPPKSESESPNQKNAISLASSVLSVSSADGNIRVLQDGRLQSISPSGAIEHESELLPPADKLSPTQMAAAGASHLFVSYDYLSTGGPVEETNKYRSMLTVVQMQTGEETLAYRLPQAEKNFSVSACAASLSDFLFIGSDEQGRLAVVHYVPQ